MPVAGFFPLEGSEFQDMPNHWFAYIAVNDVEARIENALKSGAKLVKPVVEVTGIGKFGIIKRPDDAMIGWMTPEKTAG